MQNILSQKRPNRGFTLIEVLIALLILSFFADLICADLKILQKIAVSSQYNIQDEIGIYQLQITLATNKVLEINNDSIIYQGKENECTIEIVNDNLVSTPGWICFLYGIDDVEFKVEKEIVYIEYLKDGEYYEYPIAYKEKQ